MTIDHFCINVPSGKYEETIQFYLNALRPLKYEKQFPSPEVTGLGPPDEPEFWIFSSKDEVIPLKYHFAFGCKDPETVKEVHRVALEAGGKCNGKPGLRPEYTKNYYAAFFLDMHGNNAEVVCMLPMDQVDKYSV